MLLDQGQIWLTFLKVRVTLTLPLFLLLLPLTQICDCQASMSHRAYTTTWHHNGLLNYCASRKFKKKYKNTRLKCLASIDWDEGGRQREGKHLH